MSYFTLDYVVGEKTRLPEAFTGVLDAGGNGCVVIRYGGRRIASELLEEEDVAKTAPTITVQTSYFPQYMALFFSLPSGICTYKKTNYQSMRVPHNLAQHLRAGRKIVVTIRSGERVFENVYVRLGYFHGSCWSALVEAYDFDIGFKIFNLCASRSVQFIRKNSVNMLLFYLSSVISTSKSSSSSNCKVWKFTR
ncbi:hypothetical protein LIER_15164 [Lithospermum erythrorhizon]|uniref:Uncharacterized protein n=1 Tax=Lithospermum erythrorhizon TaxID=34254 RepID=A0AAV3Q1X2_LITER